MVDTIQLVICSLHVWITNLNVKWVQKPKLTNTNSRLVLACVAFSLALDNSSDKESSFGGGGAFDRDVIQAQSGDRGH